MVAAVPCVAPIGALETLSERQILFVLFVANRFVAWKQKAASRREKAA